MLEKLGLGTSEIGVEKLESSGACGWVGKFLERNSWEKLNCIRAPNA